MSNVVFDPTLLLISDLNWKDEEVRDDFLENFSCFLEMIDEFDLANIYWSDSLQEILVSEPQLHPWYQSDLKNSIIAVLHNKFYSRTEYIPKGDISANINPEFQVIEDEAAHDSFLRLVHELINLEEEFILCLGIGNRLENEAYEFSCKCHNNYVPSNQLNCCNDWFDLIDEVEMFFPLSIDEFDEKFEKGLDFVRRKYFEEEGEVEWLYEFEFEKKFKKSIIGRQKFQREIFQTIVHKLTINIQEARTNLRDEYIKQHDIHRFRVTGRPSSTRIHYQYNEGTIIFDQYYGEGEHDDGL